MEYGVLKISDFLPPALHGVSRRERREQATKAYRHWKKHGLPHPRERKWIQLVRVPVPTNDGGEPVNASLWQEMAALHGFDRTTFRGIVRANWRTKIGRWNGIPTA